MKPDQRQFQYPTQPDAHLIQEVESAFIGRESDELVADVESAFVSFEKDPQTGEYAFIKDIEADIEVLRANANESHLPQKTALERARAGFAEVIAGRFVSSKTPMSLEDKFVNAESEIGGDILPKNGDIIRQRFWYVQGDWFYEVLDARGVMIARYQFSEDLSHKLVDGRQIDFAEGEKAALLETINRYYTQIQVELYSDKADWDLVA